MVAAVKGSRLQLSNKIKATANYDEIRSEDKDETKSMSLSEWFQEHTTFFKKSLIYHLKSKKNLKHDKE